MISKSGVGLKEFKQGVIDKQALSAASEAVAGGIYDPTTLSAVDADLAAGNIKNGITIFGVAGAATVQDISAANAAVGEVLSPKTFFSVTGGIKTGTMPTVALAPGSNSYPAGYHAGAASLTAVDADLAAGNIKSGVTIFGVLGTYSQTLSQDLVASAATAITAPTAGGYFKSQSIAAGADYDIATTTNAFAANSMAVAVGVINGGSNVASTIKLCLYMNGVQVTESAYLPGGIVTVVIVVGTKALSGSKICKISAHNYAALARDLWLGGGVDGTNLASAGIGVGSIKAT